MYTYCIKIITDPMLHNVFICSDDINDACNRFPDPKYPKFDMHKVSVPQIVIILAPVTVYIEPYEIVPSLIQILSVN